jgi:hypothetical protein
MLELGNAAHRLHAVPQAGEKLGQVFAQNAFVFKQ